MSNLVPKQCKNWSPLISQSHITSAIPSSFFSTVWEKMSCSFEKIPKGSQRSLASCLFKIIPPVSPLSSLSQCRPARPKPRTSDPQMDGTTVFPKEEPKQSEAIENPSEFKVLANFRNCSACSTYILLNILLSANKCFQYYPPPLDVQHLRDSPKTLLCHLILVP